MKDYIKKNIENKSDYKPKLHWVKAMTAAARVCYAQE